MIDLRDKLFQTISGQHFQASLTVEDDGILSGVESALERSGQLGISLKLYKEAGAVISSGEKIGTLRASPKKMAMAEESIIGTLAKASGIATAAQKAVQLSENRVRIVSGSWKKMPPETKHLVRRAVICGGAHFRICDDPMIYLDKNYIRMLGSIPEALTAAGRFADHIKVIQIRGFDNTVETETSQAVSGGSKIIMVDTGSIGDLNSCLKVLEELNVRNQVQVAFAGDVKISDIPRLLQYDIDILCIGKEIVDARLLDMKLDVTGRGE